MKKVTHKTSQNIYNELGYGPFEFFDGTWAEYTDEKTGEVVMTKAGSYGTLRQEDHLKTYKIFDDKLNEVLGQYTDSQLQRIITGLNNGAQWSAFYLKNIMLATLKMKLRERKLKQLL